MIRALDIGWRDWELPQIPLPTLPDVPVPDLPLTPAQAVILLSAVAAGLGLLLSARSSRVAAWLAILPAGLVLLTSLWQMYAITETGDPTLSGTIGTLAFGELTVPLELSASRLSALVAAVVALVACVVQVFARWYLWYDPRYRQFSATVSLFTAAMLLVVLSGDILLTLIGWEVMGWCSFLLIGHLSAKDSANRAATKALIVTRLADVGFVIGLVALAAGAGTTSISGIIEHWVTVGTDVVARPGQETLLSLAMIGIVLGILGKSAQLPFQDWLPDAMEGPTPASALIHAATMVAAGTVVLAQLFPLLQAAAPARVLLAVLVSVTVVLAALLAFAQPDIKRLLAWSTVSQVGLMLAALTVVPAGTGPDAAIMHLISHAWFKALLFLAVGWMGVLTGGTVVRYVVSATKRYRSLRRPLGLGLLSLAGVPPLIGFVSKELVLAQAEHGVEHGAGISGTIVLAAVGASVPLTAAYCMRAWLILDRGPRRRSVREPRRHQGQQIIDDFFAEPEVVEEAIGIEEAESAISSSARSGVAVLGLLSVVGGLLVFTPQIRFDQSFNLQLLGASLLLMALAALAVWVASRGVGSRDAAARLPITVSLAAERGLGFDRLYQFLVVRPVLALAHGVQWADREVLDAYVRATGPAARLLGGALQHTHPRRPAPGLVLVLGGLVALAALGVVLT
ncbi:NADH-quinone oxidoreductase subunit L [Ornithinimicrobium ciconiae]|uniref:NADH-quinone oxidoreductase subunit L n=1 Tax=Ornithinimicrobium ciconiae TaxID=2594265 RepID=A0A516G8B7_9MICO|nr:NADH-quinone oxidoreductase subunit L [Ornithinimicrobium ciconiae]QDO87745.1 NADH-quinone oxidoreductase subunit L [Ornithinimicrobium ciconiae]